MLARVTPRGLSALPGVFISMPPKQETSKGVKADVADPELSNSNVFSVGEGVLLRWLSYHLEQANKVINIGLAIRTHRYGAGQFASSAFMVD